MQKTTVLFNKQGASFVFLLIFFLQPSLSQNLCPPVFLETQPLNGAVELSWVEPDSLGGFGSEVFSACFPLCETASDGFTIEHIGQDTSGGWFQGSDGEVVGCGEGLFSCSDGGLDHFGAVAVYSDTLAPINSRLSMGPVELTPYTSATMYFDEYIEFSDFAHDSNWVEVSVDGVVWTPVYYSNPMGGVDGYYTNLVDLSDYVGQNIYIAFRFFDSVGYNENWYIDNIRVFGGLGGYENPCGTLAGYNIYQDGMGVGFSETTSFVVSGLTNNTEYCFSVSAVYDEGESVGSVESCSAPVDPFELSQVVFRDTLNHIAGEHSTFEFVLINQDTAIHDFYFDSDVLILPTEDNILLSDNFNTGESVLFFDPDGFWSIGTTEDASGTYLSYPQDSDGSFFYWNDGSDPYYYNYETTSPTLQSQAVPYDGSGPVFFMLDLYYPQPYGGCLSGGTYSEDAFIVVSTDNGASWVVVDSTIQTAVTWSGYYAYDDTEASWHTLMYNITPYIEPGIFNVGIHYDDCGGNWSSGIGVDNIYIVQGNENHWLSWERVSGKIVSGDSMSVSLTMMPQENQNHYEEATLFLEGGSMFQSVNIEMITDPDNVSTTTNGSPFVFKLHQSFPNPFNPSTEIVYDIPRKEHVSLVVYDIGGRVVRSLTNEIKEAGSHVVVWGGKNDLGKPVPAGLYIYSIVSGKNKSNKKTVLLK